MTDEGIYRCEATNPHGTAKTQATGHVEVSMKAEKPKVDVGEPPRFIIPLEDCVVTVGSPIELECKVTGVPMPSVKWSKDGRPLVEDGRFEWDNKPEQGHYRLRIRDAGRNDEGTYRCVATNDNGQASTKAFVRMDEGMEVPLGKGGGFYKVPLLFVISEPSGPSGTSPSSSDQRKTG
jgi:hypothetical protein